MTLMKVFCLFLFTLASANYGFELALNNARKTAALLKTSSFTWTAVHGNADNKHFEVDVYKSPHGTRLTLFFVVEKERQLMSTTYIFKDHWLVEENGRRGKYRPYEAPYSLPTAYYYLLKSQVQTIDEQNVKFLGRFQGQEKGLYRFWHRTLLREKQAAKKRLDLLREQLIPAARTKVEKQFYLGQMRKLLDYVKNGKVNLVDESSGVVTRLDSADGVVLIKDFQLVTIAADALAEPSGVYEDFTAVPDKENIVFMGHNETWQLGMVNFQTDGRILNYKTKSMRRIPFRGAVSTPMCFDQVANIIYVTGILPGTNDVRPYKVDLNTGAQTPVGGRYFYQGHTSSLTVSPDKNLIAALHVKEPHLSDKKDLVIVDSQRKKILRYPLETLASKVIWHPDNESVYLLSLNEKTATNTISKYTPGGAEKTILQAVDMMYLPDQQRLMFLDAADQKWKTSDLDGKGAVEVNNGLQKLQYPAYGKSSHEILMIQEDENGLSVPVFYDLHSKAALRITTTKGLWLTPVWR